MENYSHIGEGKKEIKYKKLALEIEEGEEKEEEEESRKRFQCRAGF